MNGTITSPTTFKNGSDSTVALAIQNSSGTNLFVVDTLNNLITLKTASATPTVLVLSDKNTAGDPATCTNGGLYYNSNSSQIRACLNGALNNTVGTNTGTTIPTTNLYDGRTFALRAGSTPFEFIDLIYDGTYGKWVSDTTTLSLTSGSLGSRYTAGSSYVDYMSGTANGTAWLNYIPIRWKKYDDVGLKPQMRFIATGYSSASMTGYVQMAYQSSNIGDTSWSSSITWGGETTFVVNNAVETHESDWVVIPGGYTIKDFIRLNPQLKSNGSDNFHAYEVTGYLRWVSP